MVAACVSQQNEFTHKKTWQRHCHTTTSSFFPQTSRLHSKEGFSATSTEHDYKNTSGRLSSWACPTMKSSSGGWKEAWTSVTSPAMCGVWLGRVCGCASARARVRACVSINNCFLYTFILSWALQSKKRPSSSGLQSLLLEQHWFYFFVSVFNSLCMVFILSNHS